MPFFAPLMLIGLAAAAAPILLHLFRRRTARRIVWGAWQFLSESMRRKRRSILLEEILLLVVRTLILALAAIAFARPFIPEMGFFGGGEKDVVIVIDRSGSMNLRRPDGSTAFAAALGEARDLVERAPRGISFGVVLGSSAPEALTATPFSSKREVLKLLDGLKAGSDTMDVPRTLEAAAGVLSGGRNAQKEIVIFGDGQGYGWRPDDANAWRRVKQMFSSFARRPPVVWRTLERAEGVRNAAIASVTASRSIFGTDRPLTFSATVVNSGSTPFSPGELALAVDGKRVASQPVGQILPGLSRTIPFSHRFDRTGPHTVVTSLAGGDDIAADNVVTNPVSVIDELRVLLVNGRPGASGFDRPTACVEAALRPERKGDPSPFLVRPVNIRPSELESTNVFGDVAVAILCDVPFLTEKASRNLARWISSGGGLLVVPGEKANLDFYTNWVWRSKRVLPAVWTNFTGTAANGKPPAFAGAPVSGRMLFDERSVVTDVASVDARFDDGEAGVVSGSFGRGRIRMLAMPLDFGWSALPSRPEFVPFVHDLVYSLSSRRSVGSSRELGWSAYEGDVSALAESETDAIATHIGLSFARLREDVLAAVVGRRFGIEIWRPIAIAVLLLMIAEILLSRCVDRRRASRGTRPKASPLRAVLRGLSLLALGWMLLHLVWVHDRARRVSRRVAVLVDRSLSMRRRDLDANGGTNAVTRFDVATNLASRLERELSGKYDVADFSFGSDTTDFAAALEDVRARVPPEELAGAVLVTDGRPTAGPDVEPVARLFARQGAKVSSVVVGSLANRPDLAITDVASPENLFLGERLNVRVALRADRLRDSVARVKFLRGERVIDTREVTVDGDEWSSELRFSDEPKEKGLHRYRIVVDAPDADLERENDAWPFDVSVSDDRTAVLIADRRPRWEFRYLRNLLYGRDKSVHLQYVLTEPDRLAGESAPAPVAADATRAFGEAEAERLPSGREAWRKFDVLVFGDLSPDAFSPADLDDIGHCVRERGATAIFVSGERYMPLGYAKSPLAELFPVTLTNSAGQVVASWRPGAYRFAVTGSGSAHGIMSLSDSSAENARIWETGREWQRRVEGLSAKPGSETLAFAGDSDALAAPLVVIRHVGRGRVLFLASDETWRFRYKIGDTYHHRFWGNVLRWCVGEKLRDGNAFARVGTDRIHYSPTAKARICVRLKDADALPLEDMEVVAKVRDPRGGERTIVLSGSGDFNGVYAAEYAETSESGVYEVEIGCPGARRLLGANWPERLSTTFEVKSCFAPVEFAHLSSDRALPDAMAKLTGGTVTMAESLAVTGGTNDTVKALLDFGPGSGEAVDRVESHVWSHPLAFIVLAASMILVLVLRKRRGLA